jgi:acetolactate synthase-1/2/3 large subunit
LTVTPSIAPSIVDALKQAGAERIFGIPGGGPCLDLIEAAERSGMPFVLARDETSAVLMAGVTAELSGSIGVALTGRGPGLSNAINGIAHASLDRAPVIVFTDALPAGHRDWVSHQSFDQPAAVRPVTKGQLLIDRPNPPIDKFIQLAMAPPAGPVLAELAPRSDNGAAPPYPTGITDEPDRRSDYLSRARDLLTGARRPVIIAGLEARTKGVAASLRQFARQAGCPVLATYKAKGVYDSSDPLFVGLFTGGSAEAECVSRADLIVLAGMDPVELIPQPWRYEAPVLDIAPRRHDMNYIQPTAGLYGDMAAGVLALHDAIAASDWREAEIRALREAMDSRLDPLAAPEPGAGLAPRAIVELAQAAAPEGHRITVDAGAHMFSAMAYCRASSPCDVLISNGLATMAFALPAAIASALHEPDRTVIALTGDGGLLMCLGELATAVQHQCPVVVIVLNDSALSLIDIKQRGRGLQQVGVTWPGVDFAGIMESLGGRGYRADSEDGYRRCLDAAIGERAPALIDVRTDASGYSAQLEGLRS